MITALIQYFKVPLILSVFSVWSMSDIVDGEVSDGHQTKERGALWDGV